MQDGLLTAWNKRDQFQGNARLETWIHRIIVNAALQLLRQPHQKRWQALDDEHASDAVTPFDQQSHRDTNHQLTTAMQSLTEMERICFTLKHMEKWRLQEIAEELDVAVNSIKQAVFRAVRKLRESMAEWRSEL